MSRRAGRRQAAALFLEQALQIARAVHDMQDFDTVDAKENYVARIGREPDAMREIGSLQSWD